MTGFGGIASRVCLGFLAGVLGGMFGIGGGLIIVPALILIFTLDPKTASGTSLMAQLPPVALLAVLEYGRRGQLQVGTGLWIAVGLTVGGLCGALLTGYLSGPSMKRLYGVFLLVVGIYFLLAPQGVKPKPRPAPMPELTSPADQEVH